MIICENCQNNLATCPNGLCDDCNKEQEEAIIHKEQVLKDQEEWEKLHKNADGFDYDHGVLWRVRYDSPLHKYEAWGKKKG